MIKVAMIGAGSVIFSKNLTGDILAFPEFRDARFSYMDIDADRLEVGSKLCRKVADAVGANPTIEATMDQRQAVKDADFVINMVQIGGSDSALVDYEITQKYGLRTTVGDTSGPTGVVRALRTFPMMSQLVRNMDELCPRAILLNYTNPMSMIMKTVAATSNVCGVGLCHSVQGTLDQISEYVGVNPSEVSYITAGINHMAFFLKLEKDGKDLYPLLFEKLNDPETYAKDKVRFEIMRRLGYFVTESSKHSAEYSAWWLTHGEELIKKYDIPIGGLASRGDEVTEEYERLRLFVRTNEPIQVKRSHEYGSLIIHSIVTGTPRVVYGNMPNNGTISNLPKDAIVEAPTLVDRAGLQHTNVGELPPQLVAYIQPHTSIHELFIRAATEGRRDHVYQAAMFDGNTNATMGPDKIVEMCDELLDAQIQWLPKMDGKKSLVQGSGKKFPQIDALALRLKFQGLQDKFTEDYLRECMVVGPFITDKPGEISLEMNTPVDEAFNKNPGGIPDFKATYTSNGKTLKWEKLPVQRRGLFDLTRHYGRLFWHMAYAYIEIEEPEAREVTCRVGSDDGIRIWLNGEQVFSHEIRRGYVVDEESFKAKLKKGTNRFFVKINQYEGAWGFGLAVPKHA